MPDRITFANIYEIKPWSAPLIKPSPKPDRHYLMPNRRKTNSYALIMLYQSGAARRSSPASTAITAEFPKAVILYNVLGAANAGLRNLDEAIANFSKAMQIKPEYVEAHNNLGLALQSQGRFEEAIASYGKALQIKPRLCRGA